MNVLYRNKEVYPQIDEPFRCIDIYNRKASVPLWVHPFNHRDDAILYIAYVMLIWVAPIPADRWHKADTLGVNCGMSQFSCD